MKAMVLAAGVGSRLRPLTDHTPKAAMDVGGRTMLEIVLRRLIKAGVDFAVVNSHHLAEQISAILRVHENFGIRIELLYEPSLLDTGGGVKNAERWLVGSEPFFVHNADVYTELDLGALYRAHLAGGALATLAVRERETSRRFLFDGSRLAGWEDTAKGERSWAEGELPGVKALAFDGVSVCSPAILPKLSSGAFSLSQDYLRLAGRGERIEAFRSDAWYWKDVGSAAKLAELRKTAAERGLGL